VNKAPLTTPYTRLEIIDDILYGVFFPGITINIDIAKEIVKTRLEYTDYVPYPMFIFDSGVVSMNKEARDYFSNKNGGMEGTIAAALLLKSVYSEFLGNFFLRITKPAMPTKVFSDEKKALEWLQQFKPKS